MYDFHWFYLFVSTGMPSWIIISPFHSLLGSQSILELFEKVKMGEEVGKRGTRLRAKTP